MRITLLGGWRIRALRAAAVVVLAGVGYAVFLPQSHVDRKLLGKLVIPRTALDSVPHKAKLAQAINPSQSSFAATRKAGKADPGHTGLYAREWYVAPSAPPEVGVVLQLLPTAASARAVLAAVDAQLHTKPQLTQETATAPRSFSVPGVSSARGVSYLLTDNTTHSPNPIGSAYTDVFQEGRAVVSELLVTTSPRRDTATAVADVRAERKLLEERVPGFSMVTTSYPSTATLVYVAAAAAAAAAAVFMPEFAAARLRRRRARHAERELRRAREQYLARGRRTVRRGRAPAWSQPRRR
jgi:hypothetical protein